jgi:hypothetical protein
VIVRIDELKLLKRGWLDGKGEALDAQQLDWVVDAIRNYYPDDATLPYLSPTPEGNLFAEWSLDGNSVSLEIDLEHRSVNSRPVQARRRASSTRRSKSPTSYPRS